MLLRRTELEETAIAFCLEAAEHSESLLPTVPAAFRRVAKGRAKREAKLEALQRSITTGG